MAKRKYTRNGEEPQGYECCKKKCKWQGTDEQKGSKRISSIETELVCPKCGNNEFYGILEITTQGKTTKFRPILFSTPMVQAILEGRKTMTRRIVKPTPIENDNYHFEQLKEKANHIFAMVPNKGIEIDNINIFQYNGLWYCPNQVGDVLWVRETFMEAPNFPLFPEKHRYKASATEQYLLEWKGCWKPSIFMPKEACRIFLKVKAIRVERLQDISEEDAIAEGVSSLNNIWQYYLNKNTKPSYGMRTAARSFKTLWASINGWDQWFENPFVFVYEFERIEKPSDFI